MPLVCLAAQPEAYACLYSESSPAAIAKAVVRIPGADIKRQPRRDWHFHTYFGAYAQCGIQRKVGIVVANAQQRAAPYGNIRRDTSAIPPV